MKHRTPRTPEQKEHDKAVRRAWWANLPPAQKNRINARNYECQKAKRAKARYAKWLAEGGVPKHAPVAQAVMPRREALDEQKYATRLRHAADPQRLLDLAPGGYDIALAELPRFFRVLAPAQVDRCWVGCVMSGITAALDEGGRFPTRALCAALVTARDSLRPLYAEKVDEDAADAATVALLTREPMRTGA